MNTHTPNAADKSRSDVHEWMSASSGERLVTQRFEAARVGLTVGHLLTRVRTFKFQFLAV
jgi:hypothetical protein